VGRIRIIAGELKGRRIAVPDAPSVRPTAERVREALFSILGRKVEGVRVLDGYSGSGALGFEALSRGAREVVFLERDRTVARGLEESAEALGVAARCTVLRCDSIAWLSSGSGESPFALIFADPPYAERAPARFLALASDPARLAPGGWIVLERDRASQPLERAGGGVLRFRTARYGNTCLDFFSRPDD
jgi:16S rRNA (guanine966-N2)-methyltransferase